MSYHQIRDELEEDERLDALDPLRHLRHDDQQQDPSELHGSGGLDGIIPPQPVSAHGTISLQFDNISLSLAVDPSPGCGGLAWPAGEVLSAYMTHRGPAMLRGKSVLELGSGTGLVGLVTAKLGAERVCITDQAPLLETMRKNVGLNNLNDLVDVEELNWGEPIPPSILKADIILAADCVYFEPAFPLLVQTLTDLVTADNIEVLFCYKKRRKADKRFFTLLKKEFTWSEVTDHPNQPMYARQAISLLRLQRK